MALARDQFGNVVEVADDAQLSGASTARALTPEEAAVVAKRQEIAERRGGLAGVAQSLQDMPQAAQLGFARGLTLGGSDALIATDDRARLEAKSLSEENPFSSMGGQIASVFVPFGAAGLAARGGQAIAGLGKGAGIAGSVLARGGGAAFEGAAFGLQEAITEASLGDTELTGEKILQHVTLGAALGGVFGAGEGFVVGGANRLKGATGALIDKIGGRGALTDEAFGAATKAEGPTKLGKVHQGLNPSAKEEYITAAEVRAGVRQGSKEQAELGERLFRYTDEAERTAAMNSRAESAAAAGSDFLSAGRELDDALRYDARKAGQGKLIDKEAALAAGPGMQQYLEKDLFPTFAKAADEGAFVASPNGRKAIDSIKKMEDRLVGPMVEVEEGVFVRQYERGLLARDPERAYSALRELKDHIDDLAARTEGKAGQSAAYDRMRSMSEGLQETLENGGVWGERAVAAEREINAAAQRVRAAEKNFKQLFASESSEVGNPLRGDPRKFRGWLKKMDSGEGLQSYEDLNAYLSAREAQAEAVAKHLKPGSKSADALERMRMANKRLSDEAKLAARDIEEFAGARAFKAGAGNYGLSFAGFMAGNAIGVGGVAGALGADVVARYPMWLRRMANVRGMLERTDNRILKGVADLFKPGERGAALLGVREKLAAMGDSARGVVETGTKGARRTMIVGGKQLVDQYQSAVDALSQPDDVVAQKAVQALGPDIQEVAPESTGQAAGKAVMAANYLRSQIPQTSGQLLPMNPMWKTGPDVSVEAMRSFMDKVRAVSDPVSILEEAKRGTLTRDMVKAVEATSPKLIEDIRAKVLEMAAQAEKSPPYTSMVAISVLFDVAACPEMAPEYIISQQQTFAVSAQQRAPMAKSQMAKTGLKEYADSVQSTSDSISGPLPNRM